MSHTSRATNRASRRLSNPEERETLIIAVALEVFGERGLHATRLTHVARRAQLSTATLKRYFPNTAALFREAVRQTVMAALPLATGENGSAGATHMLLQLSSMCWTLMRSPRFVILQRLVLADLRAAPELSHVFIGEVVTPLCRMAERIIGIGMERGEFRAVSAPAAARFMISTLLAQSLWYGHPEFFHAATNFSETCALGEMQELLLRCLRGDGGWPYPPPLLHRGD